MRMAFKGYFTLCLHRTSNLNSLVSNSNLMKQIELKSKNNNSFFSGHNSNLQTRQFHSKIEIKSKSNQTFDFENGLKSSCDQQQFFMNQESTKQFHSTIMKNNNQTSLIFNLIPKFSNLSLFSNIIFQTRNFATKNVAALLHRERRQKTIEAQTMKREEMVEKQKQRQLYRERKERLAALETNKHELQSSSSEQSQTQTQTPTSTSTPTMSKLENEEKDMEFMTDEQYEKLVAQQEPPEPLTEEEIAELRKIGYDLPEDFGVNSQSTWSPKEIIKVKLVESELEEKFIRGSGNGGQGMFVCLLVYVCLVVCMFVFFCFILITCVFFFLLLFSCK